MKNIFTTKIQLIIGIVAIAVTVAAGIITGCSYESSTIMSGFACIGTLSLLCPLFSKINKKAISYILYMVGNIAGALAYLFVISKYEQIGQLYMILFLIVVFLALFIYDICIVSNESVGKRVVNAIIMNVIVHICVAIAVAAVLAVSVIIVGV